MTVVDSALSSITSPSAGRARFTLPGMSSLLLREKLLITSTIVPFGVSTLQPHLSAFRIYTPTSKLLTASYA